MLWARTTPNVSPPDAYSFGLGGGTSTATPQVAGTAALWLSYYAEELVDFAPVERVEACRRALLLSAVDAGAEPYVDVPGSNPPRSRNDYFGDGRLNAAAALEIAPVRGLPATPADRVSFWDTIHLPFDAVGEPQPRAVEIRSLWEQTTNPSAPAAPRT